MILYVTQFSFDGSEREQFASVHTTLTGAVNKALEALNQTKTELMSGLDENDPDYEFNKLTVQGPEILNEGSTCVQLVNCVGN